MMPYVGEHFGAQTTHGDGVAWLNDSNSKTNIERASDRPINKYLLNTYMHEE
jgi:hypothetical protein